MTEIPKEQNATPRNWSIQELMDNGASPQEIWGAYRNLYEQYLYSYPLPQEKQEEVVNRVVEIDNEINNFIASGGQNPEQLTTFVSKLQKLNTDYTGSNSPLALPNGQIITQTLNNSFVPTPPPLPPQEQIQQTDQILKDYTPEELFNAFKVTTEEFLAENKTLSNEQKIGMQNAVLEMEKQIGEKFKQYQEMTPEQKEKLMQETMQTLKDNQESIFTDLNEEDKIRFQQLFDANMAPFLSEEEKEKNRKSREVWTPHITSNVTSVHYGPFVMFLLLMFPLAGMLGPVLVFFQAISPGVFPWSKNKKHKGIQYTKKILPAPPEKPPRGKPPTPPEKPNEPKIPLIPRRDILPVWPVVEFREVIPVFPVIEYREVIPVMPIIPFREVIPVVPVIPFREVIPVVPIVPVMPFAFYQEVLDINLITTVSINISINININIKGATPEQMQAVQKEIAELVKMAVDLKVSGGDTKEIEEKLEKLGIKPTQMEEIFEQVSPKKVEEKKEVIDTETRDTTAKPDIDIAVKSNAADMDLTLLNTKFGIDITLTQQQKTEKEPKPVIQFEETKKPIQKEEEEKPIQKEEPKKEIDILPKPDIPFIEPQKEEKKPEILPKPSIPIFKAPSPEEPKKEPAINPLSNIATPLSELEEERKRRQEIDAAISGGKVEHVEQFDKTQMTEEEMKKRKQEIDASISNVTASNSTSTPKAPNISENHFQQQLKEQQNKKDVGTQTL